MGLEGLPLQYIVLVLVAALVIGAVVAITISFTNTAQSGGQQLNQTVSSGVTKSTRDACVSFGCIWNTTSQSCSC